jgi:hypothetical protein
MENGQALSAVWRERLQAQQASGLSVATWCRQAGVSAWSVYAWRKRLSPAPAVAAAKLLSVPVSGMAPGPMLELQTPSGYSRRPAGRRKAPRICESTAVSKAARNRWCCSTTSRGADTRIRNAS